MSKKNSKTAEDLTAELASGPGYLRRAKEREDKRRRREEKFAQLTQPILDELRDIGFAADSIEDLVKRHAPLPDEVVSKLLARIEPGLDERHCECLVRVLGAARNAFDGTRLAQCYDLTWDESLRWAIANTIALARPHSIDEWIKSSVKPTLKKSLFDLGYFA